MALPEENSARFRRQRAELAINLAMQSRWDDAVAANQSILAVFPTDVDALNRLGKAFTELGRFEEARNSYSRALSIEPSNSIAKKNLARLSSIKSSEKAAATVATRVDPRLFIEEAGKTAVATLRNLASREVVAKVTAGDQVNLEERGEAIQVYTLAGDYLGLVEPRIGTRVANLMRSGNRYEAAITSVTDQQIKVIIREVYQSANNAGRISFPTRAEAGFRPYIKDSVLQYGLDEEDEGEYFEEEAEENGGDWSEEEPDDGSFTAEALPVDADEDEEEE